MPSQPDKSEILSRISLFEGISRESRQALADICIPKIFKKKQVLFSEGDKGFFLYVLVTGSVQLLKNGPDAKQISIRTIKPGEIFAEVILFESDRYPVSAIALKTSQIYQLPRQQFLSLLNEERFRNEFLANLMRKLRYLAGKIEYLASHDVETRFFSYLEEQFGRKNKIMPDVSKKDIATGIGATPETFSRLLLKLKKKALLRWDGKTIIIADEAWLKYAGISD